MSDYEATNDEGNPGNDGSDGPRFSDEHYEAFDTAKTAAVERICGPMDEVVGHAIIPYAMGGGVDMYYFSKAMPGTVLVTMELIEPDGTGPKPNRLGTYELVAATRHPRTLQANKAIVPDDTGKNPFATIERHLCGILTMVGRYSTMAVLQPGETAELPNDDGDYDTCILFDEFDTHGVPFEIAGRPHGLLLVMEVHRSEMEYAREQGSAALIKKLKKAKVYPYSDLDRPPVA